MEVVESRPAAAGGRPGSAPSRDGGARGRALLTSGGFLLPALVLLGLLVAYPICYTVWRSLFSADGSSFVGVHNYVAMFTDSATFTAIKNNVIWVVVAPAVITVLGLIFAVMTERIRWAAAFKMIVFMPMAISMVAAGVIFTLVYDHDPNKGVLNAIAVGVHDTVNAPSLYQGARPRDGGPLHAAAAGAFETVQPVSPGQTAGVPLVAVAFGQQQALKTPVKAPVARPGAIVGAVWLDFVPGGGGVPNQPGPGKKALPGVRLVAVSGGKAAGHATSQADGSFVFSGLPAGAYTIRAEASNFAAPYNGVTWLGPGLITPAVIGAYVWMWAGFAMVLIGAGLAAIPRDALEAARVDGASEFQVFRKITVPLLAPVLIVVLVTLIINVLKIFDLVYIIAPGSTQQDANVLALQMYLKSFTGASPDRGLGSAIAVLLFLLVLPAMIFNIRRFRRERS
jgi:alpha-glucoside transport system permease protein